MSTIVNKIEEILKSEYSVQNYVELMTEILDGLQTVAPNKKNRVFSNYSSHILGYSHIGTYNSPDKKKIIVMSVELKQLAYVENSRTTQRSFAKQLIEQSNADAALIAFYTEGVGMWRLSFVRLDYEMKIENGKLKAAENLTPARRYSFLVGKDEPCHTAIDRFRLFIESRSTYPTLDDLENAFSVESVTKEFFDLYCDKFIQLRNHLESSEDFIAEATLHNYTSAQFAKKLMGQIVFLYFLQKKGWLGVKAWPRQMSASDYKKAFFARGAKSRELIPKLYTETADSIYRLNAAALQSLSDEDETFLSTCVRGEPWGSGPHNFMRKLFEEATKKDANFFDDYLEPLFYDALNVNRGEQGYDPALHCRIPFLSGGLFEPIDGYDWKHNNFGIPNEIFSNRDGDKDRLADGILDIFDRYNFTMSEDEPMEREVAIDPEMLGKVFENLLDITDRKSKGAFYTPREIVHYMCQESLINYLTNVMKVKEMSIRDFILYGDMMTGEDASVLNRAAKGDSYDLWISEELYKLGADGSVEVDRMAELDKALQDVRVADPAVGSGAFPLGMLNEIVRARQNITTYMGLTLKIRDPKRASSQIMLMHMNDRAARQLKYETIRNCIFAADIEPSAVDIAQLRLWLSLVIDDEINPNATSILDGHRNPLPLPNLECNILCGNSLIDEFEGMKLINESDIIGTAGDVMQVNLYQRAFDTLLDKLIEKQEELFRCDDTEKKYQILQDISALRDEVIMSQLKTTASAAQLERYEEAKMMASKPYVLWQLDFAKVFREKGGFDIVVGNPPYIQLQKSITEDGSVKLGDLYKNLHFKTFAKTGDIYCLFYEKGYKLLHDKGLLAFITSNKWMRAGYGKALRGFFAENTNPIILIDFAGQKIFESATVDVNILLFAKEKNAGKTMACVASEECRNNLSVYIARHSNFGCFSEDGSWTIMNPIEQIIRKKIDSIGTPLSEWDVQINYGIKTGCNEAFIVNGAKKDELIAADPKSAELIRPILRGRDIKRYEYVFADLWIINVHNGIKGSEIPSIRIEDYPAIKAHLDNFYLDLEKRADKGETPYNLRNCAYMEDFSKQKIVWGNLCLSSQFAYADEGYFVNAPSPMIVPGNKYILAVLNSRLGDWYIRQLGVTRNGGYFEYKPMFVEKLPIPQISESEQKQFIDIVNAIIEEKKTGHDTSDLEATIDALIYKLYKLTPSEIEYIEANN